MGFNISGIAQYVNQEKKTLLAKLVAGANTLNLPTVNTIEGIKAGSAESVKLVTASPTYLIGSCATASGTSATFVERNVSNTLITVYDGVCTDDMTAKLSKWIGAGAKADMEVPTEFIDALIASISSDVAKAMWQGSLGTLASNMLNDNVTGWLKRLVSTSYSASTFSTDATYTAFTSANAIAAMDDFLSNMPAEVADRTVAVHMPPTAFNALTVALRNANYFNFGAQNAPESYSYPAFANVTIVKDNGLSGAEYIVAAVADLDQPDLLAVYDLKSDIEDIEIWYDQTLDKVLWRIKFAVGTEIGFPSQIGVLAY